MADDTKTEAPQSQPHQPAAPAAPPVDASGLSSFYTNWCRVTGTPEELVLDFGLNTQMGQAPAEAIKLTNRVVMNFYTAKRLLLALNAAIQRHEQVFGVLEVDIQKRVRGPGMGPR
ncbi:MAG TPA: DUF3467 domain-containing protein [Gemmataceae bacterium]|nr:DUF3467 domain-containing protein [Gemmataceae bacterium]